jgi:diketogulonate reductase-like aldo/keto reductase
VKRVLLNVWVVFVLLFLITSSIVMLNVSNAVVTFTNGVRMPQLGLGVWKTPAGTVTENAVKWALQAGYRHIDTALLYMNEQSVGKAIRESGVPREEIFVTTKLWNTDHGYESTLAAFETSRKNLGLDYVDLYLIHWPRSRETIAREGKKYLDTWRAFEKLYEEKKVRAIGVSNFKEHHLDDIMGMCTVAPMLNQVELHPLNNQAGLRKYCEQHSIQVEAWSPLGGGQLLSNEALAILAEKYHKSVAQVVLRWGVQHNLAVIPKSIKRERIESNAKVFDFELSATDMAKIDAMNKNHRYGADPDTAPF